MENRAQFMFEQEMLNVSGPLLSTSKKTCINKRKILCVLQSYSVPLGEKINRLVKTNKFLKYFKKYKLVNFLELWL